MISGIRRSGLSFNVFVECALGPSSRVGNL